MRISGNFAAWIAILYLASPAAAWDGTGHRIIAAIAYERLTPNTRARVDALIRAHPDYAAFTNGAPADAAARARAAFIAAAVWADNIKGDRRFYDDTKSDAQPTPTLPGYPDMKRHTNWHYYDKPYTPDGARRQEVVCAECAHRDAAIAEGNRPRAAGARRVRSAVDRAHHRRSAASPCTASAAFSNRCRTAMQGGNLVFVMPGAQPSLAVG